MNKEPNFLDFQYAVAQDVAPTKIQINITTNLAENEDARKIDEIQAYSCAIEMVSKDLHYRAKGKPFYGIHLLADLVNKIGEHKDDLNEVFYLGDKSMPPPLLCYTSAAACKVCEDNGLSTDNDEDKIVDGLRLLCDRLAAIIEEAKKQNEYKAGVHAVLDSISADALQASGLLHRTSTEVDIQASGVAVAENASEEQERKAEEIEAAEAVGATETAEELAAATGEPVVVETTTKSEEA